MTNKRLGWFGGKPVFRTSSDEEYERIKRFRKPAAEPIEVVSAEMMGHRGVSLRQYERELTGLYHSPSENLYIARIDLERARIKRGLAQERMDAITDHERNTSTTRTRRVRDKRGLKSELIDYSPESGQKEQP